MPVVWVISCAVSILNDFVEPRYRALFASMVVFPFLVCLSCRLAKGGVAVSSTQPQHLAIILYQISRNSTNNFSTDKNVAFTTTIIGHKIEA